MGCIRLVTIMAALCREYQLPLARADTTTVTMAAILHPVQGAAPVAMEPQGTIGMHHHPSPMPVVVPITDFQIPLTAVGAVIDRYIPQPAVDPNRTNKGLFLGIVRFWTA
jgi:hypothetical protein